MTNYEQTMNIPPSSGQPCHFAMVSLILNHREDFRSKSLTLPVMAWWYCAGQKILQKLVYPYWPVVLEGVENVPRHGGVILAGNHPTVLDGGMLGVFTPRRVKFLIDAKVLRLPVLGAALRALGSIPVERGGNSLGWAEQALRQGHCLGIYPEATPTGTLQLGPFKRGVAVLAQQSPETPVVPVAIVGSQPLCSHHHKYAQPGPIALRYGPPLHWVQGENLDHFLGRLRNALEQLQCAPLSHGYRFRPSTALSAAVFVPSSATLLALSRQRFEFESPTSARKKV
jgi:1-acyl-sn-glycerol-3-phosphate acyltransferase